jgi:hypothetical protein
VVIFERQRHSNRRDDAFTQPLVPQLATLARALRQGGVRDLMVVVPHAPALLPQALAQGLATLDEATVAALGFEHLVFVRAAQDLTERQAARGLQRVAQWCLSQLRFMVPNAEQPLRSTTLAMGPLALPWRCRPVRSRSARSCAVTCGPEPVGKGCSDGANQFWPGITPPVMASPRAPQRLRGAWHSAQWPRALTR